MASMRCPRCKDGGPKTHIVDSRVRPSDGSVRRRYYCSRCSFRWTTREMLVEEVSGEIYERLYHQLKADIRKLLKEDNYGDRLALCRMEGIEKEQAGPQIK